MEQKTGCDESRRGFIKKLAFVPPAIVTLSALPSIASAGSPRYSYKKDGYNSYKRDGKSSYSSKKSYSSKGSYGGKNGW